MLVDVELNIDREMARSYGLEDMYKKVQTGVYSGGLNLGNGMGAKDAYPEVDDINAYGVVDDLEQLLKLVPTVINSPDRNFVISICEMRKEDQPPHEGWRWHKWGPYYGDKEPQFEYLADEPEIDNVWVYHIYEIGD